MRHFLRMKIFPYISIILQTAFIQCSPNILFIIIDDLRPILSCYGDNTAITPNIDQIATNGILFRNVYSQQSLCAPSRTSLLTSRRPDSLHLYDSHSYWRHTVGNFTTLPQYFKEHGYFTESIGKVFHPGIVSNHTDDYPLSWSVPPYHGSTEKYKFSKVCPNIDGTFGENLVCPVDVTQQPEQTLPDIQSSQYAINFINNYNNSLGIPFFLAIGFHKPHIPLKYPRQYLELYPMERIDLPQHRYYPFNLPEVAWNPWTDLRIRDDMKKLNVSFPFGPIPDYFQRLIRQSYYAATSYIDDLIGQILETLNNKMLLNNTVVVLLSDHGWSLGEHGEWSKYSNYDYALKIPLILVIPNNETSFKYVNPFHNVSHYNNSLTQKFNVTEKGIQIDDIIELVDIFPTLCDITRLAIPPLCRQKDPQLTCTEGVSVMPIIMDSFRRNKTNRFWKISAFSQYPRPNLTPQENSDEPKLRDIKIMGYTLRTRRLRYTEWIGFNASNFHVNWSRVYSRELYFDHHQNYNLADRKQFKQMIRKLSRRLRRGWRSAMPLE